MADPTTSFAGPGTSSDWVDLTAALVQSTGFNRDCSFARVLITFDPARRNDVLFLNDMLQRIFALNRKRSLDADQQFVQDLVKSAPDKSRWQRWQLPASFTDGIPMFLCEVPLYFQQLPEGESTLLHPTREMGMIPCRARPAGGIQQLPYTRDDLRRREEQFVHDVAARGVRLTAIRVQANHLLFEPRPPIAPGLVVITFESHIPDCDDFLMDLADRIYELKAVEPRNAVEREVRAIVMASEQRGVLYRRRRLPAEFTGGPVVYAADLIINPRFLRRGHLTKSERRMPVVAERGAFGAIELVPFWEASGEAPPVAVEPVEVHPVDSFAPDGDWIDVTDAVLGPPVDEVAVVSGVDEPVAPPRKKRTGWIVAILGFLVLGSLVTCVGGSALWYFVWRDPIHLSHPRPAVMAGFLRITDVDYELRRSLDPAMNYQIVVQDRRSRQMVRLAVGLNAMASQGTTTFATPQVLGFGIPQQSEYEVWIEAIPKDGSGPATRVSNSITYTQ